MVAVVSEECVTRLASPGIALMEGLTGKFADVETAGFDVGDQCAYRDIEHLQTPNGLYSHYPSPAILRRPCRSHAIKSELIPVTRRQRENIHSFPIYG